MTAAALRWLVRRNTYHDSVKLMRLSEALASRPGVDRAAAVMGTPLNIELLTNDGLLPDDVTVAPDDLLIAVLAASEQEAEEALAEVDALLAPGKRGGAYRTAPSSAPHSIEEAAVRGGANLAVIAVPGPMAAAEAFAALRAGLHVFLFSDNVALEDEVRLKELAARRDLLMMGPDCGTAIIDGIGLGFANRVERGPVGIVGASGTGIQQCCSLLDIAGIGIAQAIGTGGRDLSAEVAGTPVSSSGTPVSSSSTPAPSRGTQAPGRGSMTCRALRLLESDSSVEVILVISKPADPAVTEALHQEMRASTKPVVACLLGTRREPDGAVRYARTLTEAAGMVAETLGRPFDPGDGEVAALHRHAGFHSRVYGLFTGGTLRSEAAQVLDGMGVPHTLVDLGDDRYTLGRAHPMIDPRFRASILPDVGRHGDAGALLLDVVLGDLAHPDPAGALVPAVEELRRVTDLPVLAVLIGTRRDPQGLERQREILERASIHVFASNARAAAAAGALTGGEL